MVLPQVCNNAIVGKFFTQNVSTLLTLLTKTLAVSKQLLTAAKWSAVKPSAILSFTISGFFSNMVSTALK